MEKKDWPICLCITSILGKPFEVGRSNKSSSSQAQASICNYGRCFLDMQKIMLSLWKKKLGSFRHTEKVTSDICGPLWASVLWGIILRKQNSLDCRHLARHWNWVLQGALWRWMLQDIIHLKLGKSWSMETSKQSVLCATSFSAVSKNFQSKSPLCVQTPSYSLDPVAQEICHVAPLQKSKDWCFLSKRMFHNIEALTKKNPCYEFGFPHYGRLAVPVPDFLQSALSGPLKVLPPSKWMGGRHYPCLVPPVLACFTGLHRVCQSRD